MDPNVAFLITIGVFLLLLVAETSIAFSLAAAGAVGLILLRGGDVTWATLGSVPYRAVANYTFAIVPMYVLLGMFALNGQLAERLYHLSSRVFRRVPGGLGVATVGACAGFGAVTGSSVATAATIGRIAVAEMQRYGYPTPLAAGIVASAGTLGVLIPPSIVLVIYGVLANTSIGALLLAGFIPGVISAIVYMTYIMIRGRSLPDTSTTRLADVLPADDRADRAPATERPTVPVGDEVRAVMWISLIFVLVLAGIYTGRFTVIESGGLAAAVAMVMVFIERSRRGVKDVLHAVANSLKSTAELTSFAFAILIGASVFSSFLVVSGQPTRLAAWLLGLDVPPFVVPLMFLLVLIPVGMFLETFSMMVIFVPLMAPVVAELGYEPVWFGILFVKMIEIGLVTPPIGMNAFIVSGASGVRVEAVFRGIVPMVGLDLLIVVLLFVFPDIVMWLPRMLR